MIEKDVEAPALTIAEQLAANEGEIYQAMLNEAATLEALEDKLARGEDVRACEKALAGLRSMIERLKSTRRGLERRRVIEKRDELRDRLAEGILEHTENEATYQRDQANATRLAAEAEAAAWQADLSRKRMDASWFRVAERTRVRDSYEREHAEAIARAERNEIGAA